MTEHIRRWRPLQLSPQSRLVPGSDNQYASSKRKEFDTLDFNKAVAKIAAAEWLTVDPRYGLILIDETESSLHPRAQGCSLKTVN